MLMFLFHVHHHISFPLLCCQGDAKNCILSKQLNNQEERLTQSSGEFEQVLHTSSSVSLSLAVDMVQVFATMQKGRAH